MEDKPMVVNGQFIDTREPKTGFLESNEQDALMFYRCNLCHKVVSLFDLRKYRACGNCGNGKVSPTNLSFWEKLVQICKHPKIWTWQNEKNRL